MEPCGRLLLLVLADVLRRMGRVKECLGKFSNSPQVILRDSPGKEDSRGRKLLF